MEIDSDKDRTPLLRRLPQKPWQLLLVGLFGLGVLGAVGLALLTLILTPTLPSIDNMTEGRLKVPMRVYTADKVLIGEFGEERRIPIKIDSTPPLLVQAILAAEDDGFYEHHGVDFLGIARAVWINFRSGGHRQGASTITMQVARNFFLSPEKTYTRKLREVLLSFKLERDLSKEDILELYLNKIFLGNRAYGFAAAARIYYGRNLPELTLPELAMLAGLPKAPSANNPLRNKERALERRNYILGRMFRLGFIDEALYRDAALAPLSARKHKLEYDVEAPYISEMVRQYMLEKYENQTYAGGFHVYTTIDSRLQRAANAAVRDGILAYDRRHGYRGPAGHVKKITAETDNDGLDKILDDYRSVAHLVPAVVKLVEQRSVFAYTKDGVTAEIGWPGLRWARRYINTNAMGPNPESAADILKPGDVIYVEPVSEGFWRLAQIPDIASALVSLRPNDGAMLALTGGFDFYASKFNRIIQAERQPGSNIKPFIYSAALDQGFTAATTVSGAPIAIEDATLEDVWRPENYSGKFFGPTRLRKALTLSLNLVSVRLLRAIGPGQAVEYLGRFGFDTGRLPRNLSLALGSASVTPLTLARAFGVFANGGFLVEPYFITRIEDGEHNILEQANPRIVCRECPESRLTEAEKAQLAAENGQSAGTADKPTPADATANKPTPSAATPDQEQAQTTAARVMEPRFAPRTVKYENTFIMTSILQSVIKEGTGRRALTLERHDLAGKTGTTNEYKDAWFSGFNRDVVTTSWIGFDQPASMGRGEAGASAALPIWIDYMKVALEGRPETPYAQPDTIVTRLINKETGEPTTDADPEAMEEYFVAETLDQQAPVTDDGTATPVPGMNETPESTGTDPTQKADGEKTEPAPPKLAPGQLPEGLEKIF